MFVDVLHQLVQILEIDVCILVREITTYIHQEEEQEQEEEEEE